MSAKPLNVTQPFLPPLAELTPYLEKIWESKVLTNGGPFHQQLEEALQDYLGVPYISLFSNGTLALMAALKIRGLKGNIVTTPYSFVATANAISWAGLTPKFADVDQQSCNLDPAAAEAAIDDETAAIMPVHCYGTPCDVEGFEALSKKHGLPIIYDAAHAFGVRHKGQSLLNFGDMAALSFHATKVFGTVEGGAVVCQSVEDKTALDRMKNFGIVDEENIETAGLNAKMNEVQAAFGLASLPYQDEVIAKRQAVAAAYRECLQGIPGLRFMPAVPNGGAAGSAYFPLFVTPPYVLTRDALYQKLKGEGIMARRYFYPLLSDLTPYVQKGVSVAYPNAAALAQSVLCLPLHAQMDGDDVERVCNCIKGAA